MVDFVGSFKCTIDSGSELDLQMRIDINIFIKYDVVINKIKIFKLS